MLEHLNSTPVNPARVVVIGAGGFIGGAVADRVERDGVPVLRLGRGEVNLLAPDAAARLTGLLRRGDSVVAAAAIAPCKTADMLRDNVTLALALVKAIAAVPVAHVVNISSDAVFADSPALLTETSCASPESLHGAMHLVREVMFKSDAKAPLAILRPTLVYGAKDPHNGYGPNQFRRKSNRGEDIVLFGEGEERRDHVYIDDVAKLVAMILERRSMGDLNAATGIVMSFREVAETAMRLSRRTMAIKGSPRQGPMPHNGYRPFDPTGTFAAFPEFRYTPLVEGMAIAQTEEFG